MSKLGPQTMA